MKDHANTRALLNSLLLGFGCAGLVAAGSGLAQTLAADCATPGKDGNASNLSGILNTYYPGTGSPLGPAQQ